MRYARAVANGDDAKTVSVFERLRTKSRAQLVPDFPDTKAIFAHIDVVQQDDALRTHPWEPGFNIMADSFIRVQAIDMQKVDAAVGEVASGRIKIGDHQPGKSAIDAVMVGPQIFEHFRPIKSGMFVASPSVYREARGIKRELVNRLAKRAVGVALVRAKFD